MPPARVNLPALLFQEHFCGFGLEGGVGGVDVILLVVLGNTVADDLPAQTLLKAGLALDAARGNDAPAQHWAEAADVCQWTRCYRLTAFG